MVYIYMLIIFNNLVRYSLSLNLLIAKHFLPKSLNDEPHEYNIFLSIIINLSWNVLLFINFIFVYYFSYLFFNVSSMFFDTIIMCLSIFFKISINSFPA